MQPFVLAVLFQFACTAQAADQIRYFTSADSPSTALVLLETDIKGQPMALLKLTGVKSQEADKVFMFEGEKNNRFMPAYGATNMVFIVYNRKTLIAGTVKKTWTLAGLEKDITLHEVAAPAGVTAEALKAEYEKTEGAGSYGSDVKKIAKAAEDVVNEKCGTTVSVQPNTAGKAGPPEYKTVAAAYGIAELCADKDYVDALKGFKKVSLKGITAKDIQIEKNGSTLILSLPTDIQNTSRAVKKVLEKKL